MENANMTADLTIGKSAFGDFVGSWHKWFAWKPVYTYDRRFVWLRPVWRRSVYLHQYLYSAGAKDFWWWYSLDEPSEYPVDDNKG